MTDRGLSLRAKGLRTVCLWLGASVALGLLLGACGSSSTVTTGSPVTGTVTHRERVALPDGALVVVQIQDVSLLDAQAGLMGEEVIHPSGRQVPVGYAVPYDEDEIDERHSYSVSARIYDGEGNLLFISDTAVPVITQDNPIKDVRIVVVSVGSP
jgi:putative lipoprotein